MTKRLDKYVYSAVCLVFIASLLLPRITGLMPERSASQRIHVEIQAGDEPLREFELPGKTEPQVMVELDSGYGYNLISIAHDGIKMLSSDCPGGDCLRFPRINHSGGAIVCLPHKLLVKLEADGGENMGESKDSGVDAIAY